MTRTYLRKPSTTQYGSSKPPVPKEKDIVWRSQPLFDDSFQSPVLKTRQSIANPKKTLKTLGNPSLFSPESDSSFSRPTFEQDESDPFDRLCSGVKKLNVKDKKENIDPFDLLVGNGTKTNNFSRTQKPVVKVLDDIGICYASPDTPELETEKNDTDDGCKLFSSFTKEDEDDHIKPLKVKSTLNPKLRKPKSYRARAKKSSASVLQTQSAPADTDDLNSTLGVKLKYSRGSLLVAEEASKPLPQPSSSVIAPKSSQPCPTTSLLNLTPKGLLMNCSRSLKTSTPMLFSKSSGIKMIKLHFLQYNIFRSWNN